MKKIFFFCVIIFFAMSSKSFSQQKFSGDTWENVKRTGSGTLTITYVEAPAFVYKDAKGELQGICVDILNSFVNYVQNSYKVKINVKFDGDGSNFRQFYESVKNSSGGVIGLGNVTVKEDRKKEVQFTPPFIKNIALLVTNADAPEVTDPSEFSTKLAGYKAIVPKGTTHDKRMLELKNKYFPELVIEYTSSSFEAMERTIAEKKSICFQDIALYWDYKVKGSPVKYINFETEKGEELAMILPLDSDWKPLFDEFFSVGTGFKSSNIYRTSLIKHLGTEVVQMLKMAQ